MKTCTVDGCVRKHLARGYCGTHYNRLCQTPEQRHRKVTAPCARCQRPCVKGPDRRYVNRFCSLVCRDDYRAMCKLPALFVGTVVRPKPEQPVPKPRASRLFVAGTCARCGSAYVAEDYTDTARYCSTRCGRRVTKQRYRARKKNAYVADVRPARIYERDGWRCQLCRRAVRRDQVVPHPLAPVIDHIIPLARGGTHEPTNVQCAHFMCNSVKSDRVGPAVQLLLVG